MSEEALEGANAPLAPPLVLPLVGAMNHYQIA